MRQLVELSWVALAFTVFYVTPAQAQTIRVQSGDHAEFTRLVLPIGPDRDWDLTQTLDGEWNLTLTPAVDGFDTSGVFDLIQRERLANLSSAQSLSLDLACDCDVNGFRYDTRFLVIDIRDPDPDSTLEDVEVSDTEAAERAAAADTLPDLANLLRSPDDLPRVEPQIIPPQVPTSEEVRDPDAPNPRLAEAAQIMAEQLARAAAAGLLDVAENEFQALPDLTENIESRQSPTTEQDIVVAPDVATEAPPAQDMPVAELDSEALPIRAETAFDTVLQRDIPISDPPAEESCENTPFNIAEWGDGQGLYHNLGALRLELYDERDMLRPDGVIELAQHYLYYGFGAEAAYWLDNLSTVPDALREVAALVDGADTAQFLSVDSPVDCSEGELLWRYMAGAVDVPLTDDDTSAIQRAYGNLPTELRDHMGPRLAIRLAEDGYTSTARNIRDILERGGRIDVVSQRMLDLDLGIERDESGEITRQALDDALRDSEDPAAVLSNALAFDRRNGVLPTPSRLTTADALMREIGFGRNTDDLWREALLGHAALGQIDEAINRLGDPSRSDNARAEALTELISERVSVGDTAALVILAHTHGRNWRPEGSAAGRVQVQAIAALREEGLFEAAQILRDVRRPLILPAPNEPPAAPEDPATIAWQAGDWQRLADSESGVHSEIAERLAALDSVVSTTPTDSEPANLNSLNATLQDSRALRTTITQLLAQPTLP